MKKVFFLILTLLNISCEKNQLQLEPVSYANFEKFIIATGYQTDAEKYDWSIVQKDVFNYEVVQKANWKYPDGINPVVLKELPVTQISYNDAIAYCKWVSCRLPTYDEYWKLIQKDNRKVIANFEGSISSVKKVNILGNVWEITQTSTDSVRLAGGSLFCTSNTCNGTVKERELYVDKETGNIHIGFAVILNVR